MGRPPIIDTHQHFWRIGQFAYTWMTGECARLRKHQLPEHLKPQLDACGVTGTVAVQADQSVGETHFLLDLAAKHDFILGVVGWVDLTDPDIGGVLERTARDYPALKGIRHIVQDEPDDDWLVRADVLRGLREVAKAGLTYDLLSFPKHIKHAATVARECPGLKLIIDHASKPHIASAEMEPWASEIKKAARIDGLHCKISGMVTEADHSNWTVGDLRPYVDVLLEAFGPERLTYGSDWPVCTLASTYERWFEAFLDLVSNLSESERERIFHLNARAFYNLDSPNKNVERRYSN